MIVNSTHRDEAEKMVKEGATAYSVQRHIQTLGLTKCQANNVVRNIRKRLGMYEAMPEAMKEEIRIKQGKESLAKAKKEKDQAREAGDQAITKIVAA